MPLIMDDEDQYMDDLFGDTETVHLNAAPVLKGLDDRLEELFKSGCCQKIAWSKLGSIVSIAGDSGGLEICSLERTSAGEWVLTKPTSLSFPSQDDLRFSHVAWSPMGNDLAAIDSSGRILICTTALAINRMHRVRDYTVDPDDEKGSVIGFYWLPVLYYATQSRIIQSATGSGDDWTYNHSHRLQPGPGNPLESKNALTCLTRTGKLRLLFQQPDSRWVEVNANLECTSSSDETFTHASFAPGNDGSLFLVAHDVLNQLYLYRISINWGLPATKETSGPPPLLNPSLNVITLFKESYCFPLRMTAGSEDLLIGSGLEDTPAQLTHLHMVSPPSKDGNAQPAYPTIMANFACKTLGSTSTNLDQIQSSLYGVIARWTIRDHSTRLHSGFEHLTVKKKGINSVGPQTSTQLKRLPDTIIAGSAVLSIEHLRHGNIFALVLSDGSIEFRRQDTLNTVTMIQGDYNEVSSMPQAGFVFPHLTSCSPIALSPNACMAAIAGRNGKLELKKMGYGLGSFVTPEDDSKLAVTVAATAAQCSSAFMQYQLSDDIMAVIPKEIATTFKYKLLRQIYAAVRVSLDYSAEDAQKQLGVLLGYPLIQKCISVQHILGVKERGARDISAKLAWTTLNLRLVALTFGSSIRPNVPFKPEMAISLLGNVRWSLDLMAYIVDELIDLAFEVETEGKADDWALVQKKARKSNSPALFLVLASVTRIMLRTLIEPLNNARTHADNSVRANAERREAFATFLTVFDTCAIKPRGFSVLVNDIDAQVRSVYAQSGLDDAERGRVESDMFIRGEIPQVLMPVVQRILTALVSIAHLQEKAGLDPARVRRHDYSWLGLVDDAKTRAFHRSKVVDVLRKIVVKKGARLKRCVRCRAYVEDLFPVQGHPLFQQWLMSAMKECICRSNWVVVEPQS